MTTLIKKTLIPWPVMLCMIGLLFIGVWRNFEDDRKMEEFSNKLDVDLSGIITRTITTSQHNFGLIDIAVTHSKNENVDPRDSIKNFYCVVKNKKAEIVMKIYLAKVGDSIVINTKKDSVWDYRNGRLEFGNLVSMTQQEEVYDEIRDSIRL